MLSAAPTESGTVSLRERGQFDPPPTPRPTPAFVVSGNNRPFGLSNLCPIVMVQNEAEPSARLGDSTRSLGAFRPPLLVGNGRDGGGDLVDHGHGRVPDDALEQWTENGLWSCVN